MGQSNASDLDKLDLVRQAPVVAVQIHTATDHPRDVRLLGIAVATSKGESQYFGEGEGLFDSLFRVLASHLGVICHDSKRLHQVFAAHGEHVTVVGDTMLLAYLENVNESSTFEAVVNRFAKLEFPEGIHKSVKDWQGLLGEMAGRIVAQQAAAIYQVYERLEDTVGSQQRIYDLELRVAPVLAEMETRGIAMDRERLESLKTWWDREVDSRRAVCNSLAGKLVEWNSPQQVATFLHTELRIPHRGWLTGTRRRSVSEESLKLIRDEHEIVPALMSYRKAVKLSSLMETIREAVDAGTSAIHTTWLQAHVPSGRLASRDINIQNIAIVKEANPRQAFVARLGHYLLEADYNQIEIRIAAGLAQEPVWLNALAEGRDIHKATAAQMLGKAESDITPGERTAAKTINFGLLYGMNANGLAMRLEIEPKEAQDLLQKFFATAPKIKSWIDRIRAEVKQTETVATVWGRVRRFPEVHSDQRGEQLRALRGAVNHICQGTAGDILKTALVNVHEAIQPFGAHIVITVHDSVVLQVPIEAIEAIWPVIQQAMAVEVEGLPPFTVKGTIGPNWGDMKPI